MSTPVPSPLPPAPKAARTAVLAGGLALLMGGLAYASVPLYNMFCRATGYGGTPMVNLGGRAAEPVGRAIEVRLDANVSPALPWRFKAEQSSVSLKLGETVTAFFKVRNVSARETTGIATFNVQPELAGSFFNKVQCFCFNEMKLRPGEEVEVPVVFFVDPALVRDPDIGGTPQITLSYTFFPSRGGSPVAVAAGGRSKGL